MDIDKLLYRLGILSKSAGYKLIAHAIRLRLSCEDWDPSLKALQQEVAKVHYCTYDTFKQNINRICDDVWQYKRNELNKIAFLDLSSKPTTSQFLDILYNYLARSRET